MTTYTASTGPSRGGRPEVGNPVHVRLGDLLDSVDTWQAEHGERTRADAIRELVRRGLNNPAGERILRSPWQLAMYDAKTDSAGILDRYAAAIEKGTILRNTEADEPGYDNHIRIIGYTDPLDNSDRYLVELAQPGDVEWTDYTTQSAAEVLYEDVVRSQADAEYLYRETDVDGAPVGPEWQRG